MSLKKAVAWARVGVQLGETGIYKLTRRRALAEATTLADGELVDSASQPASVFGADIRWKAADV